jgi:glycosyltransferase involved in cell wall biosynthesis
MADGVLVTNDYIGESVRTYSPRIIPHNNCLRSEQLPEKLHSRGTPQLRIGYVGSGYRIEEFRQIWDALLRISQKYGDRIMFEFWGLDVSSLPPLASKVVQKPFTFSYPYYVRSLQQAEFDILLIPMLDHPKPRLGKSLIKFYEVAVAGALGIFSDVPQYVRLEADLTCLKTANNVDSWYQALELAIEMPVDKFDLLRRRCLEVVHEEFSAEGQIDLHEAALRAIEFHSQTRSKRYPDGSPRIMYVLHSVFFGGAELQLWRRLRLIRKYGIEPIVVIPSFFKDTEAGLFLQNMLAKEGIQLEAVEYACFTEPRSPSEYTSSLEREQIRNLLERCSPVLVHTVTFIPSFGQVCQEMNIPHVSTFYAVEDDFGWINDQPGFTHCEVVQSDCLRYAIRWSKLLGDIPKFCARDMAPDSLFAVGQRKHLLSLGQPSGQKRTDIPGGAHLRMVMTGTFQERKQQLETIKALGRLKREGFENFEAAIYGYTHFFSDYVEKCRREIRAWGLEKQVSIQDFTENLDEVLASADILLSLSTYESFPGSIKDAMAARVLIVATPVGGIPELIVDQISGLLCEGTDLDHLMDGIRRALLLSPEESSRITEHARKIARLELHPYRAANDLFRMYTTALDAVFKNQGILSPLVVDRLTEPIMTQQWSAKSLSKRANIKSPTRPPSSTMPVGAGLVYHLTSEKGNLAGLDVFIGTHLRQASGQLIMAIYSATGNLLRSVSIELARARDNDWVEFRFQSIVNSMGQQFRLEFRLENPGRGTKVSLYQNAPHAPRSLYLSWRVIQTLGFKFVSHQLYCREWYEKGS